MRSNGYIVSDTFTPRNGVDRACAAARTESAFQALRRAEARIFEASGPRLRRADAQ